MQVLLDIKFSSVDSFQTTFKIKNTVKEMINENYNSSFLYSKKQVNRTILCNSMLMVSNCVLF